MSTTGWSLATEKLPWYYIRRLDVYLVYILVLLGVTVVMKTKSLFSVFALLNDDDEEEALRLLESDSEVEGNGHIDSSLYPRRKRKFD